MYDWGYGGMPHGGMGFGMGGWILMVLLWVLLIVGIVVLVKWLISSSGSDSRQSEARRGRALEILRERYARGEIDHEEFDERRRRLED